MMMAKVMTMTYIMTMFTIIGDQDDDCDIMTINLGQGHGNNCELDHLQDVDMGEDVDWDGNYDDDDINYEYGDGHIDLEGSF